MKFGLLIDQAIGKSFEYHVSGGYKFLMQYYRPGDDIYIFGFSRGAYTARFLAEMIQHIGLLSRGNEEMVRFVFASFSEVQRTRGKKVKTAMEQEHEEHMLKFRNTFCRPHVRVHFLGLFDCVNSVSNFEVPFARHAYSYIAQVSHPDNIHVLAMANIPKKVTGKTYSSRCVYTRTASQIQTSPLRV